MSEFVHMPKNLYPDASRHVNYEVVYRGTKNIDVLTSDDFIPSNIEYENQKKTFNRLYEGSYSISLFTDLEKAKRKLKFVPMIKSFSKGKTSILRGISTQEVNKHVDYFLYDYINNSPCDDFEIVEVKNNGQ